MQHLSILTHLIHILDNPTHEWWWVRQIHAHFQLFLYPKFSLLLFNRQNVEFRTTNNQFDRKKIHQLVWHQDIKYGWDAKASEINCSIYLVPITFVANNISFSMKATNIDVILKHEFPLVNIFHSPNVGGLVNAKKNESDKMKYIFCGKIRSQNTHKNVTPCLIFQLNITNTILFLHLPARRRKTRRNVMYKM